MSAQDLPEPQFASQTGARRIPSWVPPFYKKPNVIFSSEQQLKGRALQPRA